MAFTHKNNKVSGPKAADCLSFSLEEVQAALVENPHKSLAREKIQSELEILRQAVHNINLSMVSVSKILGVSNQTLHQWLDGTRFPRERSWRKISKRLTELVNGRSAKGSTGGGE